MTRFYCDAAAMIATCVIVASRDVVVVATASPSSSAPSSSGVAVLRPGMSVSEVANLVAEEWHLPCMKDGLEHLAFDGDLLLAARPTDFTAPVKHTHFPKCLEVHWRRFFSLLHPDAPTAASAEISRRRLAGSETTATYSGIAIANNQSRILLGELGDVVLKRSDHNQLTLASDVVVEGSLVVDGISNINQVRCSGVTTTGNNGNFTIPVAPADGDYIVTDYVDCEAVTYSPTKLNRWACDEEGGLAYPVSLLCSHQGKGFPTDCDENLVYFVDAWQGPPVGDEWPELSGNNTDSPAVWTQVLSTATADHYHDEAVNGGAVVFEGNSHVFRAKNVVDFPVGNEPFTWEVAFSVSDLTDHPHLAVYGTQTTSKSNGLYCPSTGFINHYFYADDNTISSVTVDTDYHIAVTYDQSKLIAYTNGIKTLEVSEANKDVTLYGDDWFNIGGGMMSSSREGWEGNIYYVRLYNRPLTDGEITNHYDNYLQDWKYRQDPK